LGVSAVLRLRLRDACTAEAVRAALLPEVLSYRSAHTEVSLNLDYDCLLVEVRSDKVSSLRALLNSYLRWISCAEETLSIFTGEAPPLTGG